MISPRPYPYRAKGPLGAPAAFVVVPLSMLFWAPRGAYALLILHFVREIAGPI